MSDSQLLLDANGPSADSGLVFNYSLFNMPSGVIRLYLHNYPQRTYYQTRRRDQSDICYKFYIDGIRSQNPSD